jgi:hypothetical protein
MRASQALSRHDVLGAASAHAATPEHTAAVARACASRI